MSNWRAFLIGLVLGFNLGCVFATVSYVHAIHRNSPPAWMFRDGVEPTQTPDERIRL